jgi:hypothetical protein
MLIGICMLSDKKKKEGEKISKHKDLLIDVGYNAYGM